MIISDAANGKILEPPAIGMFTPLDLTINQDDWTACLEEPSIFECENINLDDGTFEILKYGVANLEDFTT